MNSTGKWIEIKKKYYYTLKQKIFLVFRDTSS